MEEKSAKRRGTSRRAHGPEDLFARRASLSSQEASAGGAAPVSADGSYPPDIIFIVKQDGTILYLNQSDVREGNVLGTSVYEYTATEQHDAVRASLERVFTSGQVDGYECNGVEPFTEGSWYQCRVAPHKRDGRVFSATIVARDITTWKRAQDDLRRERAELSDQLRQLSDELARLRREPAQQDDGWVRNPSTGGAAEVLENLATEKCELEYSDADWEQEVHALVGERADPAPCPRCGRTGFYGPRGADPGTKYRACRFCGFWQAVGQEPVRFRPMVHACAGWPECAAAPYVWWIHPDEKGYTCPYCHQRIWVEGDRGLIEGTLVTAPSDDPSHPWRLLPQNRPYAHYVTFWENWPCTRGRVVL